MQRLVVIVALIVAFAVAVPVQAMQTAEYGTKVLASSATLIYSNQSARGYKVLVRNTSSVNIFVGRSNATTTTNSFRIDAGDAASFVLPAGDSIHGLVASGTEEVYYAASLY